MTKLARVCESIVGRIESGALRAGDRLPSEERLAQGLRVSVGTDAEMRVLTDTLDAWLVRTAHNLPQ